MKQSIVTGVKPELIKWARETISLSVGDVAQRLKRPIDQILTWETGTAFPSYSQLEKYAYDVCKRPLAVFFLPSPPIEEVHKHEFRTLPDTDLESLHPDTHLHIRKAHAYLLALKEIYDGRNPSEKMIWKSIAISTSQSIEVQARKIKELLGVTLDEQMLWKNDDHALKKWRQVIEDSGIFIFKDTFKQRKISGFCLNDPGFPLIYLNNNTTKTRQIFSLIHELIHILLGVNGISQFGKQILSTEQFCNKMAAEILIPNDDFDRRTTTILKQEQISDSVCSSLASRYGVSRESILRRFLDKQKVSRNYYQEKKGLWTAQIKGAPGGNWYASQNAYLSERFAKEVIRRQYRDELSVTQASELLGIKAKNFSGLEDRILKGAGD